MFYLINIKNDCRCNNGKCIAGRFRCDEDSDCIDNSDEINCEHRNCSESEFRCNDQRCIKGSQKCDGEYNCNDNSDEVDCENCKIHEFKCANSSTCIDKKFRCDGDLDCLDGSDEANCTCPHHHYACTNGRCILNRWRCDGWNDCIDGSDETIELCSKISCGVHAHRCRNKKCISKAAICNGKDDCGDNSDELNCEASNKCSSDQFQCERDRFCISAQFRCDGESNCIDDSDEINCHSLVCGYGKCSQICLEKKGSHLHCRCAPGYEMNLANNKSCVSTYMQSPILLVLSYSRLMFLDPHKHFPQLVPVESLRNDALDYIYNENEVSIFWIDVEQKRVKKMLVEWLVMAPKRLSSTNDLEQEDIFVSVVFLC